jgi:hypothetical protein
VTKSSETPSRRLPLRVALQEFAADHRLQSLNVLADRGLAETKPFRRERKTAHLFDSDEAAQLREIQHSVILYHDNCYSLHRGSR